MGCGEIGFELTDAPLLLQNEGLCCKLAFHVLQMRQVVVRSLLDLSLRGLGMSVGLRLNLRLCLCTSLCLGVNLGSLGLQLVMRDRGGSDLLLSILVGCCCCGGGRRDCGCGVCVCVSVPLLRLLVLLVLVVLLVRLLLLLRMLLVLRRVRGRVLVSVNGLDRGREACLGGGRFDVKRRGDERESCGCGLR